ncbi:HPr kinase/phosphorylase [Clostridium pasteurianum DSM 525 = ATCC 6013]|uniref:HPr kinase/phosphorylase n=1 Tax=Clostridium pasteurianum DSM 525 = ATCC 6013 TaxID=1262449 RepID=A0A0H3J9E8_CLOPA|nr:HPr(Ser) kinase/phosphatase [Clostridium pasteurianum]AJA48688.1 HPr kinase/phosphorylase [Clostridium pasteurianum DSM 525 = ATCC 6013]AJA52676.1 HPr kinase/phosphorylase [Clostridium pasteurianum DSM 525 = ATCC 6013]AOZ75914.1 serine kinase [Clostridium pasteurianum DSM 525 = ATCC 6013]AOZ79710.1 serine kinase [Clostridium pasteurianum]ELP59987.1 HPr kinase/phosphorylase [Clostridium pasteurianum DSM 525 = ATCC 6013]
MPVKVKTLVEDLGLEVLIAGSEETEVCLSDINRPGLQFAGFYNYFANERIQIVGKTEWSFLEAMRSEIRKKRLKKFFQFETPCIIIARDLIPHEEFIEEATRRNTWLVRSNAITTRFISKVMNYLDDKLAPETRLHGVLVDVYGFGILITGESGIGKSETALELIKRGHRLIADDAVDIKAIEGVLHARSPFITSGMLEVRGMGIIDVPALYGLSSVLETKTIDLVMYLEQWKEGKDYDRLGIDNECIEILNVPVRKMTLPIRPGRNLAVIIEAAAANYRYGLSCKISPVETINHRMDVNEDE